MGDSLHCDVCGKPATVHLTQIVKNHIKKVDLCEVCAQAKGVTDAEGFSLAELLTKSFPGVAAAEAEAEGAAALVCEQCGCATRDFKKTGRLGCPACYDSLRPLVLPLLSGLHKGDTHRGKVPGRKAVRVELRREIESVERQLLDAVKNENFEQAAHCRDRLGELRTRLDAPAAPSATA